MSKTFRSWVGFNTARIACRNTLTRAEKVCPKSVPFHPFFCTLQPSGINSAKISEINYSHTWHRLWSSRAPKLFSLKEIEENFVTLTEFDSESSKIREKKTVSPVNAKSSEIFNKNQLKKCLNSRIRENFVAKK